MIVKIAHPKTKDSLPRLIKYILQDVKINHPEQHDSFAHLAKYMTRGQFLPTSTNCGVDRHDIENAMKVIESTQVQNSRAKRKSVHLIVSFPEGENPPEHVLADVEHGLVEALDMDECQRIRVVHTDTNYLHMHIAINAIHPRTHKAINPYRDYKRLSERAHELEVKHGLSHCTARERRLLNHKFEYLNVLDPANVHRGEETFRHWTLEHRDEILAASREASDWEQFQQGIDHLGIAITRHRNGLVFHDPHGIGRIKGSGIHRSLSKPALEKRWGNMPTVEEISRRIPALDPDHRKSRKQGTFQRPLYIQEDSLYETYIEERAASFEASLSANQFERDAISDEFHRLSRGFRKRAKRIKRNALLSGTHKRRAYRKLDRDRNRSYANLRRYTQRIHNPNVARGYRVWLRDKAREGNTSALNELRGISRQLHSTPPWRTVVQGRVTGTRSEAPHVNGQNMNIYLDGTIAIQRGEATVLDDGREIHSPSDKLPEVRLMLEVARDRCVSPLAVEGSEAFMNTVALAAAEIDGLRFRDRRLQREITQLRAQTQESKRMTLGRTVGNE